MAKIIKAGTAKSMCFSPAGQRIGFAAKHVRAMTSQKQKFWGRAVGIWPNLAQFRGVSFNLVISQLMPICCGQPTCRRGVFCVILQAIYVLIFSHGAPLFVHLRKIGRG